MSNLEAPHFLYKSWLHKKSRHLKVWRRRFAVLTRTTLITYETENINDKPTEKVPLKNCHSARNGEEETGIDYSLILEADEGNFFFFAESGEERDRWVGVLSGLKRQADNCVEE